MTSKWLRTTGVVAIPMTASLISACGGSNSTTSESDVVVTDSVDTTVQANPPTTSNSLQVLITRADEWATYFTNENWLDAHEYLSPRARNVCKSGDFALSTGIGMSMFRGFLGFQEDDELTFTVKSATVDRDVGIVLIDLGRNGTVIEFSDDGDGDSWVFINGQWWVESDDWQDGCNLNDFEGSGADAKETELANIQAAVSSAMVDNSLSTITPVAATNDMTAFPDTTWTDGERITAPDTAGLVLFNHDIRGQKANGTAGTIRYTTTQITKCMYLVTPDGTVSWADVNGNPTTSAAEADCS